MARIHITKALIIMDLFVPNPSHPFQSRQSLPHVPSGNLMKAQVSRTPSETRPESDMEMNGFTRFCHRPATPSTDRLLGAYPPKLPENSNNSFTEETELNEDDIFSTGDFSSDSPNHHHTNSSPSTTLHRHRHNFRNQRAFSQVESFGILAALPEHKTTNSHHHHHHHHHHLHPKTNLSSSSSSTSPASSAASASRFIPSIPKPPQERVPISSSFSKYHQHQSAPVNVPMLSMAMTKRHKEFDEIDQDEEEGDGEILPPHEMVARAQSPMLACSVLEGVGRTLKGRDLRQVRNAVWRQTGFLD